MSARLPGLQRRLAKAERTLAGIVKQAALKNCTCVDDISPNTAEEFEMEMNRPCPIHGFRSLGKIYRMFFINPDGTEDEDPKFNELIKIYEERRARHKASK
jgi:hypothetical protein